MQKGLPKEKHKSAQGDWQPNDTNHKWWLPSHPQYGVGSLTVALTTLRSFPISFGKKHPEKEIWSTRIWEENDITLSPY